MWLFIISDALTFSALLMAYTYLRLSTAEWPKPFHFSPSIIFSSFMTFCLLSSSLTMVMAVHAMHHGNRKSTVRWILATIAGADHVFVSVDMDVLDPAHAPGVGWHEPGGLTSRELIDLVVALAPRTGGFALNEVNPMTDHRAQTSILAANLIFQFAVAAAGRP